MTPKSTTTIKALTEVKAAVEEIDGTIHPMVAWSALMLMARVVDNQSTRVSVKTKDALVALIDAMREEATDG